MYPQDRKPHYTWDWITSMWVLHDSESYLDVGFPYVLPMPTPDFDIPF